MPKTYRLIVPYIIVLIAYAACQNPRGTSVKEPPNIIYILADDLGYGDISANNPQSKINTRHIDAMANAGIRFTDAHSSSSVCTPTRYGILTGRYAWRTRLKSGVTWSWSEPLIDEERMTVADMLKKKDYTTACIGKWHLGLEWSYDSTNAPDLTKEIGQGPTTRGFDYFYGITASLDIPPYIYIENGRSTSDQIDTILARSGKEFWRKGPIGHDFVMEDVLPNLTGKALDFIEKAQKDQDPFFLYLALPAPHTPILLVGTFKGQSQVNEYADFVLMVDDLVGQITSRLERLGISGNTIVVFTSDNGCSPMADFEELADFGHFPGGPFKGHKADIYEGGHRVPFIVQWPAEIEPSQESDQIVCLTDLMATVSDITDVQLQSNEGVDSYSFLSELLNQKGNENLRQSVIHTSIDGRHALRKGPWKLALCPGSGGWSSPRDPEALELGLPPLQLFNLDIDPGEENNLCNQHPEIVIELFNLLNDAIKNGRSTPGVIQKNDVETPVYNPNDFDLVVNEGASFE